MVTYKATFNTAEAWLEALQKADAKPNPPMESGLEYYKGRTEKGIETEFVLDTRGSKPVFRQSCKM